MKANIPHTVLFFEKSPFMSVELLDTLKDHFQVYSYLQDPAFELLKKSNYRIHSYGNTTLTQSIDSDIAVNVMLSDREYIKSIVGKYPEEYGAMFFYMSKEMSKSLLATGIPLDLPNYSIQEKLGNKINLNEIGNKLNITVNNSIHFDLSKKEGDLNFFGLRTKQFGLPFIIQGELGVSGEDTFLIHSLEELISKIGNKRGKYKANRYIKTNYPISVHCCITEQNDYIEGPFLQIIGFPELASNSFQFSGNDTSQDLLSTEVVRNANDATKKVLKYARNLGYRGILGIDFLWDRVTNKVYLQEINSRLVGLTRLLTGIQKAQGITPHLIHHINQFNKLPNIHEVDKKISLDGHNYSQIYIAHTGLDEVTIKRQIIPGIYSINNGRLNYVSSSLFIRTLGLNEILINFAAYLGSVVHANQMIAKIVIKDTALSKNSYILSDKTKEIVRILKSEML
jgi:hypothetical protein